MKKIKIKLFKSYSYGSIILQISIDLSISLIHINDSLVSLPNFKKLNLISDPENIGLFFFCKY